MNKMIDKKMDLLTVDVFLTQTTRAKIAGFCALHEFDDREREESEKTQKLKTASRA